MKLFGEYLVEKNLISKDQLAVCLIDQVRSMPSYVEVAWNEKMINAEQVLLIVKIQFEKKKGFIDVLKEIGVWNQDFEKKFNEKVSSIRTPLGQLLLNRKILPAEALTHALDEYLSQVSKQSPPAPSGETQGQVSATMAQDSTLTQSAVAYLETFSKGMKDSFEGLGAKCESATTLDSSDLKNCFDNIHLLRGAGRLAKLESSEQLLSALEDVVKRIASSPDSLPQLKIKMFGNSMREAVAILWELRDLISKGQTEKQVLAHGQMQERFNRVLGDLSGFTIDLVA